MNKKIAIITCAWPPQGGGIGNNAYYHTKKLHELGYEVRVFTGSDISECRLQGVELKQLTPWFKFGQAGFLVSLLWRLEFYDIIHLYYPFFGTDLIVWLFKKWHPEKKLVLHYEMDPVGQGWQKIFFKIYLKLFLGKIVKASDKVIVLSWDHGENSYLKKHIANDKEKFTAIPNGVDTEIFKPQVKDLKLMRELGIKKNKKIILFVGGLDKQHYFKGVEVLLKAFARLQANVETKHASSLLIIGDGNLKQQYQQQAKDLRLGKKVIFTGWVKNEDLPKYYNLADVFVLPSTARTESFGIVTAEAQTCGVPAIVANWPGSRETIEDFETGFLIKPGDVDDLSNKLSELLKYDELREKMSQKAVERAKKLYSWDKVIKKIDNLYKGLKITKAQKFFNWLLVVLWMVVIFWSSSISSFSSITGDISQNSYNVISSMAHIFLYAVLTWLLVQALLAQKFHPPLAGGQGRAGGIAGALVFAFFISIAFGAIDEWHQLFVAGREVHLSDWGLDVVGSFITVAVCKLKK